MDNSAEDFKVRFVIGGTQKGGTSALAHFLSQHPQICFSKHKETHFFDHPDFSEQADWHTLNAAYARHFPRDWRGKMIGEATPVYMYLPGVAARIHAYNPAMKWVLLLRHPVDRAVSHYSMERARGWEHLPLHWALRLEKFRVWYDRGWPAWATSARHHSYLDRGRYTAQVAQLWRLFGRERVLVLTAEELRQEHAAALRRVYQFLELSEPPALPTPETIFATEDKVDLPPQLRAWMLRRTASEVAQLETSLGLTLSGWYH